MVSLSDLAAKGERKYRAKTDTMERNYADSESRAKDAFAEVGFNSALVGNYKDAWTFMTENYKTAIGPELADKWKKNWLAKVR